MLSIALRAILQAQCIYIKHAGYSKSKQCQSSLYILRCFKSYFIVFLSPSFFQPHCIELWNTHVAAAGVYRWCLGACWLVEWCLAWCYPRTRFVFRSPHIQSQFNLIKLNGSSLGSCGLASALFNVYCCCCRWCRAGKVYSLVCVLSSNGYQEPNSPFS